ncbi:hypothetical protein ACJMK2_000996 [Sinanodonta woodiana]|uniref:UvrD-like helicase ATP-binding domain-containing protein n=1 Tax=Sinanodonta woodiana TaxID=1069815 RepID=A0ABD3XSS5_SINWO
MGNTPPVSITPGISMREYLLQLYPNLDDPHELAHFIRYHHGIADHYVAEGKYIEALKEYSLVLSCLSHFCHQHVEDIWKTHSNRSMCFYKLGQYQEALFSAESCIALAPEWHKGYWRAGMASKICQGVEAALSYFVSGLAVIQKQNPEGNNDTMFFLVEIVTLILQVKEAAVAEKILADVKLPDDLKVLSRTVQMLANVNNWEGVNLLVFGVHDGPCSVLDGAAKGCTFELISVGSFLINAYDSEMDEWRIKLAVHMLKNGASVKEIGVRLMKPPVHVGIDVALKTGSVLLLKYLLEKFSAVPQQRDAIDSYGNGPYHVVIRSGKIHSTIGETVVHLLLNSGCRLDIPDALGKLPTQCLKPTDQIYQVMMKAVSQSEIEEVKKEVETLKATGNSAWKAGNYKTAIDLYTEAISRIGTHQEFMHEAAVLYSNRSTVYCSLDKYFEAQQDALASLNCDPKWHKGYWRKATALKCLNQVTDSFKAFIDGFFKSEGTAEDVKQGFLFEAVCLLHKIRDEELIKCYDMLKPVDKKEWEPLLVRLSRAAHWWAMGYLVIGPDLKNIEEHSYNGTEIQVFINGVATGVSTEGVTLKTLFQFLKVESPKTVTRWLNPLVMFMLMHSTSDMFSSLCENENDTALHAAVRFSLLTGKTTLLEDFRVFRNQICPGKLSSPEPGFVLDGNGDTVFHTMAKFRPIPEPEVLKRTATLVLTAGLKAAVKNKDGKLPVDCLDKGHDQEIFDFFRKACRITELTAGDILQPSEEGSAKFKAGDHQGALEAYSRGIWVFQANGSQVPAGMTKRDIAALYGNRSAVFLSQNRFQEALDDAVISVLNDEHWYKGHVRVGRAHRKLGNCEISLRALLNALKCAETQSDNVKLDIIMDLTQTYTMLPRDKFPLQAKIPETPITYELLWFRAAYSFIKKDCWDEAYIAYVQACTNRPERTHFPVSLKPLCNIDKTKAYPWLMQIIHYFLICNSNHQEISCYPGDTYFHAVAYMTFKAGSFMNKMSHCLLQYILDNFVHKNNEQDLLDKDGNTALHVVVREPCQDDRHQQQVITILANARVNPHIKNNMGKTVRDVTYSADLLNTNIISSIEANYYVIRQLHHENPGLCQARQIQAREILQKKFEETEPKELFEVQPQEQNESKTGNVQGHIESPAAKQLPSGCKECEQLIKNSEVDFSQGNMDDGYQKLVMVLKFRHHSRQHKTIVNKVINIIIDKLGEIFTPEVPDSLTAITEIMCDNVTKGLIKRKKWRQVDAIVRKYRNKNGSDKMKSCATSVNIVELVEDISFRTAEDEKLQIMNTVLDSGASLGKDAGRRAVKAAISEGHFKVVTELLKRGASPSALSLAAGDTPMHAALMIGLEKDKGYLTLFEMLLERFDSDPKKFAYLDPSRVNASGDCLYHLLAKCKFSNTALKAVEILCARKLNSSVRNLEGKLPINYITKKNDRRKEFLKKVAFAEVPQNRTNPSAKENIRENSKQEEKIDLAARKITEVVKCSTNRETQKKKIEGMIRLLEDSKLSVYDLSASSPSTTITKQVPAETTESLTSSELSGVQVTESGESTNQLNREKNKESVQQKSDNTVDTDAMKAKEKAEVVIDYKLFDDLVWEVECTDDVWKKLLDKHIPQNIKNRIVQKIHLLASGEWLPHLCKKLSKVPPELQLFEAKVSKAGRILWERAIAFSQRCSGTADQHLIGKYAAGSHSIIGGRIYSEIIWVWDIELDHDKLYRSVQRSAERIIKSYERGEKCSIKKELKGITTTETPNSMKCQIPALYAEAEAVNEQQKQLKPYFPRASPNETEYHILKFYSFNSAVVRHVLQNIGTTVDFPFCVTESEHAIIALVSKAPLLLVGRSGTGKTTCCLYRMWSQFNSYWTMVKESGVPLLPRTVDYIYCKERGKEDGMDENDFSNKETASAEDISCSQYNHIHQIFITKNSVLCNEVKKNFRQLSHACDIVIDHFKQEADNLPSRLQDVDEFLFPLFLTSRQLLLMLDASIGAPYFFDRKEDGSLKENIQGWSDGDGPLSRFLLLDEDPDVEKEEPYVERHDGARADQRKMDPRREVTYVVFLEEVWPQTKTIIKQRYHPSLVWTEIMSFIKGSFEALSKSCGYLSLEEYIEIGQKRAPNFSGKRDKIYKYFMRYHHFKKQNRLFDETDLVHDIYKRLQNIKVVPWVIHQIFVDETQDFTQAELYLLIQICQNPNEMFLTGDTAQSIMRGISFRFSDLKSLFFHAQQSMKSMCKTGAVEVPKQVYQLTHNYRSHAGILSLASSVLDLLVEFFPESFDRLNKDQGLFSGPLPVLLESCSFSDLAVLLRGNRRKTSHIEFGAHQAILVVDDAARDTIPDELKLGIILTIFEAKGLEFDDVLLYNFFKDSQASKEWRLVTGYLEQLWKNTNISREENASITKKSLVEIDAAVLQQEGRPRPLAFDPTQHKVLNSELKHLYTAITRARVNVWIYDEDLKKRAPMFEYFKALKLVRWSSVKEFNQAKEKDLQADSVSSEHEHEFEKAFAEKSSPADWIQRGEYFMKNALYEVAAKCFGMAGEPLKQKVALAHQRAHVASQLKDNPQAMCEEFMKAAEMYLECDRPANAARCLYNAKERELAAQIFEKLGEFEKAGEIYCRLRLPLASSRCYELVGNFNRAVDVLYENENYDMAIDTLRRYRMETEKYESNGKPIPQILITNKPSDKFNEERLSYLAADLFHKYKNKERMMDALDRLPRWQDRVEFLKQNKYLDEAVQILEENEQGKEAAKLLLIHGKYEQAEETARKTLQDNTIAQTLLVNLQVVMSSEPEKRPPNKDLQRRVNEAKALFQNCRNVDGFAEASLLLADLKEGVSDLTESVSHIKQAWQAFLDSKPYGNLAGMLECVEWIVTHNLITKANFSYLVQGFEYLFRVAQTLSCPKSSEDKELLLKYDSFYGLFSTKPDYVIYCPKQNPRCKEMIKDLLPSKEQVEIEVDMKEAHEMIASYLLNRAKGWLKNVVESVTKMRNKAHQCYWIQVGLPCPDMKKQEGRCPKLHYPLNKRTFEELIEIDKMFIEFQRNIELRAKCLRVTCPASLAKHVEYFLGYSFSTPCEKVDKFTSCRMMIEDLIPVSYHSHVLASGYPSEVLTKMNLPVKEYMKVFMEERWKEDTKGERIYQTIAVKSADVFLLVGFWCHLFNIDFDFDKKLTEFESVLSKEQNKEKKGQKWWNLALMTDHDSQGDSGSIWIVQSLARRFYDSYYHLTKPTADPLESLIQFTKFVALISKKAKEVLPDPKFFLIWLEFYTTLSFFLIAKIIKEMAIHSSEQQDASFFVPASYLHLVNYIEGTFPRHAKFIQKAVSHFSPKRNSHALVQERLNRIIIIVIGIKNTSLLNVFFSANLDDVFQCAMAERVLILAMTLISNVGTFVSVASETLLLQALTKLQPPEKCPKRLHLALQSVQQARCIRDVGFALNALLREREGEHLMCCKWIPTSHRRDRDHIQSTPLTNVGLLPANFLGEKTLAALSHESGLGIEVMELGDNEEEIQMSVEEKMKWKSDAAAREKAQTEKEAGIKILRYIRRLVWAAKCHNLKARVQEQMVKEEMEEKMKLFETAKVTDVMCGICNVFFEGSWDGSMTKDMVHDWSERANANNTGRLDFEGKVASGSIARLNQNDYTAESGDIDKSVDKELNEIRALELKKIKVEHTQSREHIQKQLEFHSFKKTFLEKFEPNIKFMQEKIQQYELNNPRIRSTVYTNWQLDITRLLSCMMDINHEIKTILHQRSWEKTEVLQKHLDDILRAYSAVQQYVDKSYITFKQRQAAKAPQIEIPETENWEDEIENVLVD